MNVKPVSKCSLHLLRALMLAAVLTAPKGLYGYGDVLDLLTFSAG